MAVETASAAYAQGIHTSSILFAAVDNALNSYFARHSVIRVSCSGLTNLLSATDPKHPRSLHILELMKRYRSEGISGGDFTSSGQYDWSSNYEALCRGPIHKVSCTAQGR